MKYVRTIRLMVPVAALLMITGCESSGETQPHGPTVDSGMVRSEALANQWIDVAQPSVEVSNGATTISGTVHRKPGVVAALSGRIDIEFIDTDGEVLDFLPAILTPTKIPADPNTPCTYRTEYDWVPPQGSTVRVHFVDSKTAEREDLESDRLRGSGGGGKR